MPNYIAFGLRIQSDLELPGLLEAAPHVVAEQQPLSITLSSLPDPIASLLAEEGALVHSAPQQQPTVVARELRGGEYYRVRYADETVFIVQGDGSAVWAHWSDPLSLEDTATYLLGPIMSFVLRLRGTISLHAGVVAIGSSAIAVMGSPGAGKSTTIAAFALAGFSILSDDVAPLDPRGDQFFVRPTYPHVRLWGDSAGRLFGSPDVIPLMTPNWDKRYFDVHRAGLFDRQTHRLNGIFLLDDRVHSAEAPFIEPLTPRDALVAILGNIHTGYLPPRALQAATLDIAARIAARVPVRRVIPHADPARLSEMVAQIASEASSFVPSTVS